MISHNRYPPNFMNDANLQQIGPGREYLGEFVGAASAPHNFPPPQRPPPHYSIQQRHPTSLLNARGPMHQGPLPGHPGSWRPPMAHRFGPPQQMGLGGGQQYGRPDQQSYMERRGGGPGEREQYRPKPRPTKGKTGDYQVLPYDGDASEASMYSMRSVFDVTNCSALWPSVKDDDAIDAALTEALTTHNSYLTPSPAEQQQLQQLVVAVNSAMEAFLIAPDANPDWRIAEVRMVGSYKTGTLITMHVGADFLVVLDTMPTTETANSIGTKMTK